MKTLLESLLDDADVLLNQLYQSFAKDWIDKYTNGKNKIMYLKNGTLKLSSGKLIIKNFKESKFPPFLKFSSVKGNIYIENCDIENLEGLFDDMIKYKGELHITSCPKLTSLKGLPLYIEGGLTVVNNKSLKDLGGHLIQPTVLGDVYFMKNGKRWTDEQLKKQITIIGKINESVINEEINEPHLLKLAKQLIDKKQGSFIDAVGYTGIAWDKVSTSNVEVFNMYEEAEDARKAVRSIISKAEKIGLVLVINFGEYTHIINGHKRLYSTKKHNEAYISYTDIIDIVNNAEKIICIDLDGLGNEVYIKRRSREKSREGMVLQGDPEYYRKVAKENIKRYKEIIAKNKLVKNRNYEKLDKAVQEALNRVMQAVMKVHKDPIKFADKSFELAWMQELIYDQKVYLGWDNKTGNAKYKGQEGLLYCYKEYNRWYMEVNNPRSYSAEYAENGMVQCERKCYDILNQLNVYFNDFGV